MASAAKSNGAAADKETAPLSDAPSESPPEFEVKKESAPPASHHHHAKKAHAAAKPKAANFIIVPLVKSSQMERTVRLPQGTILHYRRDEASGWLTAKISSASPDFEHLRELEKGGAAKIYPSARGLPFNSDLFLMPQHLLRPLLLRFKSAVFLRKAAAFARKQRLGSLAKELDARAGYLDGAVGSSNY